MTACEELPNLTESDIARYCTEQSFERGEDYYYRGAISRPFRQGLTLRAECEGSQYEPYRVTAELDEQGIKSAYCSCPYDWGSYCKHVVALLLTWVRDSEEFTIIPETDELLAGKSREALVEIIKAMLKREPDLLTLLEMPSAASAPRQTPVDPEVYRRQVAYAFGRARDWYDVFAVASELESIKDIGDGFARQGDYLNASTVYLALARESLDRYGQIDDEGDVGGVIGECIEALGRCISQAGLEAEERWSWMKDIFELYLWDVNFGGIGFMEVVGPALLGLCKTEDDAAYLESLVREVMPAPGGDWGSDWKRKALVGFLLELYESQGRDQDFIDLAWEEGFDLAMSRRLFELGRVEEALKVAHEQLSRADDVLDFAQTLHAAGMADDALSLAEKGLKRDFDMTLAGWLADRHEERGNLDRALNLHLQRFESHPGMEIYEKVKALAEQLGYWGQIRGRLIATWEQRGHYRILADVYLLEGEIDQALTLARGGKLYEGSVEKVAQASEQVRPFDAIELYKWLALYQIDYSNRGAYQVAARHLQRVKHLSSELGEGRAWQDYIADLRAQYPRHRALQDELNKAGL
jgi:uncharacterized Zn finger protein